MARGRMISRDISLDEKVDSLSDDTARLLFTWMIPHLDVEGRIYGDPQIFKSIVAPRRNYSIRKVEKYLIEMENLGLIERYIVNGNHYIFAPHFEKHQTGLRKEREAQSKIPPKAPDLLPIKDGLSPLEDKVQVKDKDKVQVKDKDSSNNPNIFEIYEQEIGKLTPFISEELKEAERVFGAEKTKEAIEISGKANKRNWRYISGILKNWTKGNKKSSGDPDPDKYIKGKYGHLVGR